jgi:hypothetical protein
MTGNEKPVILSPKQNYTTTKGIINIQGIAPQSSNATNGRTWKANICLDKVITTTNNLPQGDGICEVTSKVATETTSPSFYSLLTVPQSTVKTEYQIKVQAEDNAGNQSPTSDSLTFTVEGNQTLTTTTTSNLTGTNTPEQILAFLDQKPTPLYKDTTVGSQTLGQDRIPNLRDLKSIKVDTMVSIGTEAVDIDLLGNVNPNSSLAISDPSYNPVAKRRLASITTMVENTIPVGTNTVLPPLNPLLDPTVKKDQKSSLLINGTTNSYYSGKNLGYQTKCTTTSPAFDQTQFQGAGGCKLTHNIILNTVENSDLVAGQYQLRTRSYKGESIAESFATFEITGITPVSPTILKIEKEVIKEDRNCFKLEANTNDNCKQWDKMVALSTPATTTFFTNSDKLRLYGATDPDATVTIKITDTTQYLSGTQTVNPSYNQVVWDSAINTTETMKANAAGIFTNTITIPSNLTPTIGNEKTYKLELTAGVGTAQTTSTAAGQLFTLKLDKKTPTLQSVTTNNLTNSTCPASIKLDNVVYST